MTVRGDVAALCLSDLEKVAADAGEADRLGGSRTFVRRWHLLQGKVINAKKKSGCHQNPCKSAHCRIVDSSGASHKRNGYWRALGNNGFVSRFACRVN